MLCDKCGAYMLLLGDRRFVTCTECGAVLDTRQGLELN